MTPIICPKCRIGELKKHYDMDNKLIYYCSNCNCDYMEDG
jgi:uncharacterized protein (DUF983 family)